MTNEDFEAILQAVLRDSATEEERIAFEAEVKQMRALLYKDATALKAGIGALGMHGPCRNNSCKDCSRADKLMRVQLANLKAAGVEPAK